MATTVVDMLLAAEAVGPALVAAVDADISRSAPAWAEAFAAAGWRHRVLSVVETDPGLADAIADEARSLRAGCLVACGSEPVLVAARRAAATAGIPCLAIAPAD